MSVHASLSRLREINIARVKAFKAAIKAGKPCYVELGCGNGSFGMQLANRTNTLVVGIDRGLAKILDPEKKGNYFDLLAYDHAENFLCLPLSIGSVVAYRHASFDWLVGRVQKTFMIMPTTEKSYCAEMNFWLKFSAGRGELHVRTEVDYLPARFRIPFRVKRIPFFLPARDISSLYTYFYRGMIKTFGLKLPKKVPDIMLH